MTTITSFVERLAKIGIIVKLSGNFPWVYMDEVNGKRVKEKYLGNHGFTVFFQAIKKGQVDKMNDITIIFNKIREML